MLFELKFSGKISKEKYARNLGTEAKQIVLNTVLNFVLNVFKKGVKSTKIQSHISSVR